MQLVAVTSAGLTAVQPDRASSSAALQKALTFRRQGGCIALSRRPGTLLDTDIGMVDELSIFNGRRRHRLHTQFHKTSMFIGL
jgi:hypothetical protein